jgi:FkbM family methyltransferase
MSEARGRGPAWLRPLLTHPGVVPAAALLLRARTVRESTAFLARELARRSGAFAYTVRAGRAKVVVRHRSADPVTLGEVFHERHYEPPPEMPPFRPVRIVDLGANVGYFGAFAVERWPGASVIAYEPDPSNAAVHSRAIELNQLGRRWVLRRAAAGCQSGRLRFHASADALSHASEAGDLVVPSEDVLPLLAEADLVKIDIEGGEWAILGDPRFVTAPPRRVVLEYHPNAAALPNPRDAARARLRAAGLSAMAPIFERADGYGMLWAWQP